MRTTKKILSMILAFVLVLGLLPAPAFASGTEDVVYLSISFDSGYIDDKNGDPIAYVPVPMSAIEAIDLTEYGLDNMLFDADGDGNYETTALQLLIYAHEELYGGDWGEVNFDALPGSSYFKGGIFGFTENLVYFINGDFPVDETQQSDYMTVGATSDRIVLEAGDFLDVASFSCFGFLWDQAGGFHLFADENGSYTHDYAATAGEALAVNLQHSFCDLMFGESWVKDASDYEISYGATFGEAEGSVTTDENGDAEITFPNAGTYYIWCEGGIGTDETHTSCDHYMETGEPCIVSSPAFAKVVVTGGSAESTEPKPTEPAPTESTPTEPTPTESTPTEPTPTESTPTEPAPTEPAPTEPPRQAQDVSEVLNATMAMQAATVTQPAFGTNYGEWTVFGLARGGYYDNDNPYFADYYTRIADYVQTTAAQVNKNGALHTTKSTDNSRLIVALSALGADATDVAGWDLVEAYSANGINWIKKQGLNGTMWALIALDSGNYETSDPDLRQALVNQLLAARHDDGGWSLVNAKTQPSNVDITGMTLTALYPYRDQPEVAAACEEAFTWLSESQLDNGGFPYGKGETSESCVWAIVACTAWGINPDTDPRFIKNGNSAVDNLLTYYLEDQAMFEHGRGAGANGMATDQATYGLVAYHRLVNGQTGLYDYSDVTFDFQVPGLTQTINATLGLPAQVENEVGTAFNAVISVDNWDNEGEFKLVDFVMNIPEGLGVTGVAVGSRFSGGEVSYHLDEDGSLRCVYFDPNENNSILISGTEFPAELFRVSFEITQEISTEALEISIGGLSIKMNSDSTSEDSMIIVNTDPVVNPDGGTTGGGSGNVGVVTGLSYSAICLYQGDDVDLIPADKKAVAVAVTGITGGTKVTYNDGTNTVNFLYSPAISAATGIATYVALVDASIQMEEFVDKDNFTLGGLGSAQITFGDANSDTLINAQDALAAVNAWLRKSEEPDDTDILTLNVNGDSRINTFDALGIVEAFVNGGTYGVITKAAILTSRS